MQQGDLAARIAVLEERTSPKPKTAIDYVKEWAGVASVLIAIGYSFPLGVWDRFIVSRQTKINIDIDNVRDIAQKLNDIDAEWARTYYAISNEQTRTMYTRAMSSKKTAVIDRDRELIINYYNQLSAPEIILLSYNFSKAGRFLDSDKMFQSAMAKASANKNTSLMADILRLEAQSLLGREGQIDRARPLFARSVKLLANSPLEGLRFQAVTTAFEWSLMELSAGDWACGESLGKWAVEMMGTFRMFGPEPQSYLSQYNLNRERFSSRKPAPYTECKKESKTWLSSGQ